MFGEDLCNKDFVGTNKEKITNKTNIDRLVNLAYRLVPGVEILPSMFLFHETFVLCSCGHEMPERCFFYVFMEMVIVCVNTFYSRVIALEK